jgi:hypothetical protein
MNSTERIVFPVHQSRWGWHPCSYEEYLRLKLLHKHYWIAKRCLAEWERWNRKLPHNRVVRRWNRDEQGRKCGFEIVGPKPEPVVPAVYREIAAAPIPELFHQARHGRPREEVKPPRPPLALVEKWLGQIAALTEK